MGPGVILPLPLNALLELKLYRAKSSVFLFSHLFFICIFCQKRIKELDMIGRNTKWTTELSHQCTATVGYFSSFFFLSREFIGRFLVDCSLFLLVHILRCTNNSR
jgi:hypothetical protein